MIQHLRLFLFSFLFLGFTAGGISAVKASDDSELSDEVVVATPFAEYLDGDAILKISKTGGLSHHDYGTAERFLSKRANKRNCLGYTVYCLEEREILIPTLDGHITCSFDEGTPMKLIYFLGRTTYDSISETTKLPLPAGFSFSSEEEVTAGTIATVETR